MNTANTTTTRRRIDSLIASRASAQTRRGEMTDQVDHGVAQHLAGDPRGRHRAVPHRRHQPAEDRHPHRHAHDHQQPLQQGRRAASRETE